MADPETKVIATGTITGPEARGDVTITRSASGEMTVHISEAWIAGGAPDVRVYLASDPGGDVGAGITVELGKVTALSGEHMFTVPPGADLSMLHSLVVYCTVYSVTFGVARLEHRAA